MVLDVVYNHVGPEGNYLAEFGPYFTDQYRTPWGRAMNYDAAGSDGVRRFVIDNALYWLTEYHIDALRLDAIHGIFDFSAVHILAELRDRFHEQAAHLGRQAWIIAESDLNDVRILNPRAIGGLGLDAQWHDEFHHALYGYLTGANRAYLAGFDEPADDSKSHHRRIRSRWGLFGVSREDALAVRPAINRAIVSLRSFKITTRWPTPARAPVCRG